MSDSLGLFTLQKSVNSGVNYSTINAAIPSTTRQYDDSTSPQVQYQLLQTTANGVVVPYNIATLNSVPPTLGPHWGPYAYDITQAFWDTVNSRTHVEWTVPPSFPEFVITNNCMESAAKVGMTVWYSWVNDINQAQSIFVYGDSTVNQPGLVPINAYVWGATSAFKFSQSPTVLPLTPTMITALGSGTQIIANATATTSSQPVGNGTIHKVNFA